MSEVIQWNVAEIEKIASDKGLVVILPEPQELLIDVDQPYKANKSAESYLNQAVWKVIEANDGYIRISGVMKTKSANGRTHVYVRLTSSSAALNPMQRIALQSCLGSDQVREALSLIRVLAGSDPDAVTALFETTKEAGKVFNWRENHRNSLSSDPEVRLAAAEEAIIW